jgi:hypothetical protein
MAIKDHADMGRGLLCECGDSWPCLVIETLRETAEFLRNHSCSPNESDGLDAAADLIDPDIRN